ncbi:MAG: CPBP family intramembrane metalloprotease [Chitinophagaceae bacterium]
MSEDYNEFNPFKPMSPGPAVAILFGMLGIGLIIGGIAGIAVWFIMTGKGIGSIEKDMLNPQFANAARMMQMVSVLFMFFFPAVIAARFMSRKPFQYLGYTEGFNSRQLILAIAITLVCFPLSGALGELMHAIPIGKSATAYFTKLEDNYDNQVQALAIMRTPTEFIYSLIVMALFPAVFEETLFRGGMQKLLIAWFKNPWVGIILTSLVFSAVHLSYFGFLSRFALGMMLGLLFYYSKSIWLNMLAHFINNAFAISFMYYQYLHGKPLKDVTEDTSSIWIGIPAIVVLVLLLKAFYNASLKRNINKIPPMDGPSLQSNLV